MNYYLLVLELFFFKQKTAYEIGLGIPAEPLFRSLKRRGCLTVPRLTLMSLIKMMLVMVSVAAISKTFRLLRFLLRLSFLEIGRASCRERVYISGGTASFSKRNTRSLKMSTIESIP